MKRSILAARTELAINRITVETARLGGEFAKPHVRGDVEHQQLALLEAIAVALVGIDGPDSRVVRVEAEAGEEAPAGSKAGKTTRKKGL